jgi:hypothetical protein
MTGRRAAVLAVVISLGAAAWAFTPAIGQAAAPDGSDAPACSSWIAEHGLDSLDAGTARACVLAVAATHLDALDRSIAPEAALLHPEVARHDLGQAPAHSAGGAERLRAAYAAAPAAPMVERVWTIDGLVAFASYRITGAQPQFRATRITLRDGLVWEVMDTAIAGPSESSGGGTAPAGLVAVAGPATEAVDLAHPDPDDARFCTTWLALHGDGSLSAGDHRRCMIAIASTYVDAEENSAANTQVLFDPRVSKHGLGAQPNHQPGNSDEIRTEIGVITRVIRAIENRQWTVDGNTVWIVYDGYLVTSLTKPGFYVAERFTIRDGLIWELTIAPVVTDVAPA